MKIIERRFPRTKGAEDFPRTQNTEDFTQIKPGEITQNFKEQAKIKKK
jgi:hypothetical protein